MKRIKRFLLCAAGGLLAVTNVSATTGNDNEIKLPASFGRFFPAAESRTLPEGGGNLIEKIGSQTPVPAKTPRINFDRRRASAASTESSVYGYLYYSSNNSALSGFYNIDVATGGSTLEWIDYYTDWGMMMTNGWLRHGKVCGMNNFIFMGGILSYNYVELDLATGDVIELVPLTLNANDFTNIYVTTAYRDLDDRIYGYGYCDDGESMSFNSAPANDIDASVSMKITDIEDVCICLCYNIQDDLLYGVTTGGDFVSIDFEGNQTRLFNVGLRNLRDVVTGLVYNPDSDTYTWNAFFNDNTSGMYSIDPKAKTVTKISDCPTGEEYIYMINVDGFAAAAAPASPSIESLQFNGASTSGVITAKMPSTTHGGSTLTGNLDWELYVDGVLTAHGTAAAGSTVEADMKDVPFGMHVFALMASQGDLRSEPALEDRWVGADYPKSPANVDLSADGVTWNAVTEGVHEGYIDLSTLKYTVYLNDAKIGETDGTSFNVTFPEGQPYQTYHAYIVASSGGLDSERGESNPFNYGEPLRIDPSIHYRPEEWELPLFKAVNVDGKTDSEGNDLTWRYTEEMAFPSFASGYDGDDWLFFPPMLFDNTEKAYQFVMEAGLVHDSDTRGRISVYLGKDNTPEAMTQTILAPHQCEYMRGDDIKEYFAVNEPGVYYIGIHAVTYNVSFHISDMDIAITERSADVPMSVSNLEATAAPDGKLFANLSFTMPTMTSNGKEINANANLEAIITSYPRTPGSSELGEPVEIKIVKGTPGSLLETTVRTAQNDNLITVACSLNGKTGVETSTTIYTGVVRPYLVQNLKAEVTEDNMGMKLTWDPPVEGEEEGAIGDDFYYTVWYYNNSWEFGDFVGWNIREYTYTLPEGAEQQWIRLGIMALNDAGQSYHVTGVTEVIGTPYTLPMVETFPGYYEEYEPIMVLRPTPAYDNTYWYVDDPADLLAPEFGNESGVAYIGFVYSENPETVITNAKSRLSLPKFSSKNVGEISFTLEYFGGLNNKYAAQFHVLANGYGIEPVNVADLPKGEGWISRSVLLPEAFSNRDWVEILLDADYANDQEFAMFSAYSIASGSGVQALDYDGEGKITVTGSIVHLTGFQGKPLLISDLAGRVVVKRDRLDLQNGFTLAPGIYIVKAGDTARKIVVK